MLTLWLLPLVPIIGACVVLGAERITTRFTTVDRALVLGLLGAAVLVVTLAIAIWAATLVPSAEWPWWGPVLRPHLAVVGIARIMVVLVPMIALPVVSYAVSSMRDDTGLARLVALLVAFTGAMELLVIASDLLTLLVGWELVGAASWALIGFEWRDASRPRAALDAFIVVRVGDLGLYLAAGALFAATGSLDLAALGVLHGAALTIVAGGILVAAAAKSAQLPFSPWLFSAMAGPTPASALLHSTTMVAAGAYLLARVAPALTGAAWFGPAVAWLGLATALAAGVVATLQSDLKRALAASTSAQYGLMLVAIGAGVPAAAAVHLVAHAAFKALLFLGAGVVLHAAGTLDLSKLRLGAALPRVARLFGIGTLALAAVPPLGGAFSKEQVLAAAAGGPMGTPLLAAGVLIAGFLSALYAGRLQLLAFGPRRGLDDSGGDGGGYAGDSSPASYPASYPASHPTSSPSRTVFASLGFLALISLALGILWFPDGSRVVQRAAGSALAAASAWTLIVSLGTIVVAALTDWLLWRSDALVSLYIPDRTRNQIAHWLGIPTLASVIIVRPILFLAHSLAIFDDRVIAAGTRVAAGIATAISQLAAWGSERSLDTLVTLVVRGTEGVARVSSVADDSGVDAAVEQVARGVGIVGEDSRRLQTGLAHQYYVILAVGLIAIVAVAALGRSTYGFTFGTILGR
ncbi:MAG: NADH-quinone oxidoreductase subunit 5 family protein [Gemmatimonadaceae bacterium]